MELWFPRFVTMQWLCSQLCYETAANQPTLVEIELFQQQWVGSGAVSLSAAHVRKLWRTAERRFVRHVCLRMSKESIPAIPFWNTKHQLLTRVLRFLGAQHAPPALHYACIVPIPSLLLKKKTGLMQRSRRFVTYNAVIVSKIWITGYWLHSQLWHVTAANKWTIVKIELLATVTWMRGGQPVSCPCSQECNM